MLVYISAPLRRDFYKPKRLGTGLGGSDLSKSVSVSVYIFRGRNDVLGILQGFDTFA